MVYLLGILCKARDNLRARGLGSSREVGCQWCCPSWRHPVMIPRPGAWTLFSGFSLTTGMHQLSRHTRPSAPCSLSPTAIPLLIHFSSPADSSPGPRDCLFWSDRSCCLSQCHSSSDFSIYPSRLQSCITAMVWFYNIKLRIQCWYKVNTIWYSFSFPTSPYLRWIFLLPTPSIKCHDPLLQGRDLSSPRVLYVMP